MSIYNGDRLRPSLKDLHTGQGCFKIYILVRGVDVDARLEEEKVEDGIVASTSCIPVKKTWKYVFSFFKIIKIVHEAGDSPWASGVNWLSTV